MATPTQFQIYYGVFIWCGLSVILRGQMFNICIGAVLQLILTLKKKMLDNLEGVLVFQWNAGR